MLKPIDCTAIEARIRGSESNHRFVHSVSVALTNIRLSHMFAETLDDDELYACGLLHDICREWSDEQLYDFVDSHHVGLEPEELSQPQLLHGPVAAALLREEGFGGELATAVRWHTLGSVDMGRMGLVLFVSDYLEPLRTHISDVERGELLNQKNLDDVALAILLKQDRYFHELGRTNAHATMALEACLKEGKRIR